MNPNEFSSHETWMMTAWLTSDEAQMNQWADMAKFYAQVEQSSDVSANGTPVDLFANKLKFYYVQEADMVTMYSIFNDLIRHSLTKVYWHEVADRLMDTYRQ